MIRNICAEIFYASIDQIVEDANKQFFIKIILNNNRPKGVLIYKKYNNKKKIINIIIFI